MELNPELKELVVRWGQIRGWNTSHRASRHAVFSLLSLDLDDEEKEER